MTTKLNTTGVVFDDTSTQNTASYYQSTVYTANSSYTKPANLKAVRVTVIGGGGSGGSATGGFTPQGKSGVTYVSRGGSGGGGGTVVAWIDASSIPASPVAVTVSGIGGTSSFGTLASATGGQTGGDAGNSQNLAGGAGGTGTVTPSPTVNGLTVSGTPGNPSSRQGYGGASVYGSGGMGSSFGEVISGAPGAGIGGGGAGGTQVGPGTTSGGNGRTGTVIVEEFF